jgi:methionyl-tRNA formyltransferase
MKPEEVKIVFLGTPEFALGPLRVLLDAKYGVLEVITAPDKPQGRKHLLTPSQVKIGAKKLGLKVYQPANKAELAAIMKEIQPDLAVVAAFGMIFTKEVLAIPRYGTLNIHASLLPRWRGPSPIQYTILNGDKETGVTIMLINEKMDEGPIIENSKFKIQNSKLTFQDLSEELSKLGAKLLIETLPKWLSGEIKPREQDHSKATYSKIIKKEGGKIDWSKSAEYIERMTRAFWPWPSAYAELRIRNKELGILKVIKAGVVTENQHKIGEVFLTQDKKLAVKCGEGSLILETIQPEGKKSMTGEEFLRGHREIIGSVLEWDLTQAGEKTRFSL